LSYHTNLTSIRHNQFVIMVCSDDNARCRRRTGVLLEVTTLFPQHGKKKTHKIDTKSTKLTVTLATERAAFLDQLRAITGRGPYMWHCSSQWTTGNTWQPKEAIGKQVVFSMLDLLSMAINWIKTGVRFAYEGSFESLAQTTPHTRLRNPPSLSSPRLVQQAPMLSISRCPWSLKDQFTLNWGSDL